MGWDECHREKGISSFEFFNKEEFEGRLLKLRVKRNVGYGAYLSRKGDIIAVVILMRRMKDPYFNFRYKIMDETVKPYNYDCPREILDMLSPPLNEHAKEWRRKQAGVHYVEQMGIYCHKAVTPKELLNEVW